MRLFVHIGCLHLYIQHVIECLLRRERQIVFIEAVHLRQIQRFAVADVPAVCRIILRSGKPENRHKGKLIACGDAAVPSDQCSTFTALRRESRGYDRFLPFSCKRIVNPDFVVLVNREQAANLLHQDIAVIFCRRFSDALLHLCCDIIVLLLCLFVENLHQEFLKAEYKDHSHECGAAQRFQKQLRQCFSLSGFESFFHSNPSF